MGRKEQRLRMSSELRSPVRGCCLPRLSARMLREAVHVTIQVHTIGR